MEQLQGDQFRALKILHSGLLGGLSIFTVIAFILIRFLNQPQHDLGVEFNRIMQAVCAVASLAALLAGFNIFKKRIAAIRSRQGDDAMNKMILYRNACILWWALIEAPGLLAVIGFFLTGDYVFLALAVFHIGLLFLFMPRKDNIIVLLKLSSEEVMELEGRTV